MCGRHNAVRRSGQAIGQTRVPNMLLVDPNATFACEEVESWDLQIVDA